MRTRSSDHLLICDGNLLLLQCHPLMQYWRACSDQPATSTLPLQCSSLCDADGSDCTGQGAAHQQVHRKLGAAARRLSRSGGGIMVVAL